MPRRLLDFRAVEKSREKVSMRGRCFAVVRQQEPFPLCLDGETHTAMEEAVAEFLDPAAGQRVGQCSAPRRVAQCRSRGAPRWGTSRITVTAGTTISPRKSCSASCEREPVTHCNVVWRGQRGSPPCGISVRNFDGAQPVLLPFAGIAFAMSWHPSRPVLT